MASLLDLFASGQLPLVPQSDLQDPVEQIKRLLAEREAAGSDRAPQVAAGMSVGTTPPQFGSLAPPMLREVPPIARAGEPYSAPPEPAPPRQAPTNNAPAAFVPDAQSFGSKLSDVIAAFGGQLDENIARRKREEGENQTAKFLVSRGVSPDDAKAAIRNPAVLQQLLGQMFSSKRQVVNNRLVDTSTGRIVADYSDTATKGPEVKSFKLVDGTEISAVWNPKTGRHEMPNGQPVPAALQETSGIPPGVDPKKYREEMAKKQADAVVAAKTGLPELVRQGEDAIRLIDEVSASPALSRVVGPIQSYLPTSSDAGADVEGKIKQLQGHAFLQAYASLRGTGAISNAEGAKAESAINRLGNLKQSDAGYAKALQEAKAAIKDVMEIAKRKASANFDPLPASSEWRELAPGIRIRERR